MRCQKCGIINSDKAKICFKCGASFSEGENAAEKRKTDIFSWIKSKDKKKQ